MSRPGRAVVLLLALLSACSSDEPAPRGVLVICVDTLRADRVGCLGSGSDLTPEIDRLGARGTRFRNAFAPAPFTAPSMATMATGHAPLAHGVRSWADFGRDWRGPTLARAFRADGWRTGFLGANGFLHAIRPVRDGYVTFEDIRDRPGPALTRRALGWIDETLDRSDPWFLWVHYFDPHAPYRHHEEHGERYAPRALRERWGEASPEALRRAAPGRPGWPEVSRLFSGLYDGEVAFADAAVGGLLRGLRERGLAATTHVVLVADHGENLADHAPHFTHADGLFDSLIRVPWIVAGPDVASRDVDGLAALEDLPRTLLDLARVDAPVEMGGRSLGDTIRGKAETGVLSVLADAGTQNLRILAFRTADRKVLRFGEGEALRFEEYRLTEDPEEQRPRAIGPEDPLARVLEAWIVEQVRRGETLRDAEGVGEGSWTSEELRQLRAFGYLK